MRTHQLAGPTIAFDSGCFDIGLFGARGGEFAPLAPATGSAEPKPHHLGHRERLRDRARAGGLGALPDYELLELYLFRTFPRADVKPLAKRLIARFGSFAGVMSASLGELRTVPGVGEAAALDLK